MTKPADGDASTANDVVRQRADGPTPETGRRWSRALAALRDRRVVTMLFLGFSAGIPLLLIFSSLSLWLREAGVERNAVTFFSWAALGYSFKFVWAPLGGSAAAALADGVAMGVGAPGCWSGADQRSSPPSSADGLVDPAAGTGLSDAHGDRGRDARLLRRDPGYL